MPLEITDRGVEPDRVLEVELLADLIDGVEDFVRACFVTCILYGQISQQMAVLPFLRPDSHIDAPFWN